MVEIVRFKDPSTGFKSKPKTKTQIGKIEEAGKYAGYNKSRKEMFTETRKQIEKLASSELEGKERKNYIQSKLTQLGLPSIPHTPKGKLPRVPMKMAIEMIKTAEKRGKKMRHDLRESGEGVIASSSTTSRKVVQSIVNTNIGGRNNRDNPNNSNKNIKKNVMVWTSEQHPMKPQFDRVERKLEIDKAVGRNGRKWYDRGLRIKTGHFKNGALVLSKRELEEINKT